MSDTEKKELYRRAANGEGQVFSRSWTIDKPKAIVQIVHDLADHSDRYDGFARELNKAGFDVYANDLIGHGLSKQGHKGAFALKKGGYDFLLEDIETLYAAAYARNGNLPRILIGVGMGAQLAELYTADGNAVDYLVLISNMLTPTGNKTLLATANNHVRMNGYNEVSSALHNIIICTGKMPGSDPANQYYWVTSDVDQAKKYVEDEDCGFPLTSSGYREMLLAFKKMNGKKWGKTMPNIPVYILAGSEDELGGFGRASHMCASDLIENGNSYVDMRIYNGDRHDLLHEKNRDEVMADIIEWLNKSIEV